MAKNITLMGANYPDVPSVNLPKTGGGTASFVDVTGTTATAADVAAGKIIYGADSSEITGTYAWNWKYNNAVFSKTVGTKNLTLANTTYSTWQPSTTAGVIWETADALGTFTTYDLANYSYVLEWTVDFNNFTYNPMFTKKACPNRSIIKYHVFIYRRPSNRTNLLANTYNGSVAVALNGTGLYEYYSSASTPVLTDAWATSYGFYSTNVLPTFSSSTAATPVITVKCPTLSAKCSSTYFSTSAAAALTGCDITINCDLYRVPSNQNPARQAYEEMVNYYLANP